MPLACTLTALLVVGGLLTTIATQQTSGSDALPARPWSIAHRGASAYAPENTAPAFEKAIEQGATYVETDVQRTRDGVLVCLHDVTLDRTTDVAQRVPGAARAPASDATPGPRFFLEDLTAAQVGQLDAGRWFHPDFSGTRIPTFEQTLALVRGRTGLFIELKAPDRYAGIEAEILEALRTHGLDRPGAVARSPMVLQSFDADSLARLAALGTRLPIHLLFSARDADRWLSPDGLARLRTFATGLSPEKSIFTTHAAQLQQARRSGLAITPWTFRATQPGTYPDVRAEMRHYLTAFEVDGVITDNPDMVPR